MRVIFRRTEDRQRVKALHDLIFPGDDHPEYKPSTALWIGELEDDTPVAFCVARRLTWGKAIFLERAGVMPIAQGLGLQRRMIRIRERWARDIEATTSLTYTTLKNYPSIVNLLRCGYVFYHPESPWSGTDVHYFQRRL